MPECNDQYDSSLEKRRSLAGADTLKDLAAYSDDALAKTALRWSAILDWLANDQSSQDLPAPLGECVAAALVRCMAELSPHHDPSADLMPTLHTSQRARVLRISSGVTAAWEAAGSPGGAAQPVRYDHRH